MSADIVNLNKARKAKAKADKARRGLENRARAGKNKAERAKEAANDAIAQRRLAALKLDKASPAGDKPSETGETAATFARRQLEALRRDRQPNPHGDIDADGKSEAPE